MVCLFANAFRLQCFLMQKCFIEIIFVWEIVMIDKFWFTKKLSSGQVDFARGKRGLIRLRAILNKSWRQHPTRHQLYGHLPPITKTFQIRRTRHAGHCWRSKDELISDVLLWTPTHGQAKAGRPARTYIQQLCEDTGCCLRRWTIGKSGERGSGISVLPARHDDNYDDVQIASCHVMEFVEWQFFGLRNGFVMFYCFECLEKGELIYSANFDFFLYHFFYGW